MESAKWMAPAIILVLAFAAILTAGFFGLFSGSTMFAVLGPPPEQGGTGAPPSIGPSAEEQVCMRACATEMGCTPGDITCMQGGKREACLKKCDISKPAVTEETSCMEACVVKGCGNFDFACQSQNQASCEQECGMVKEPPAKNAEEQCIRDCVNRLAPGTICSASKEGETGNEVCQSCSQECVHLYEGPCLNDEQIRAKQAACQTCEHCYGEPTMGDSGEGWECIVDVACKDASSEFGDEPGTGPGIEEGATQGNGENAPAPGVIESIGSAVGGIAEAIGDFFAGLLGG